MKRPFAMRGADRPVGLPNNRNARFFMTDLFANPDFDEVRFRREMAKPGPIRNYIIYFTPRSGSSWLTDLIRSTERMGNPGEWLNPEFIPRITKALNTHDPKSYFSVLRRRQSAGRIFGMEVTYFQLNKVFPNNSMLFELFNLGCPQFFLIREDIVAQAVSLLKAVTTGVYHSSNATAEALKNAEDSFAYDDAGIRQWIEHIRSMERRSIAFLERFGLRPQYLTYEEQTRRPETQVLAAFARRLKVEETDFATATSGQKKISTALNDSFVQRFRAENTDYVGILDNERTELLETARRMQVAFFKGL